MADEFNVEVDEISQDTLTEKGKSSVELTITSIININNFNF